MSKIVKTAAILVIICASYMIINVVIDFVNYAQEERAEFAKDDVFFNSIKENDLNNILEEDRIKVGDEALEDWDWREYQIQRRKDREKAEVKAEPFEIKIDGSSFSANLQIDMVWARFEILQELKEIFVFNGFPLTEYYAIERGIERAGRKATATLVHMDDIGVFDSKDNEEIYKTMKDGIRQYIEGYKGLSIFKTDKMSNSGKTIEDFIKFLEGVNADFEKMWIKMYSNWESI